MHIQISENGNHLVFIDTTFDNDGIEDGTQIGVLAIKEGTDKAKVLAKAKKLDWTFTGAPSSKGFTKVVRA